MERESEKQEERQSFGDAVMAAEAAGKEEARRLLSPAESWEKTFTGRYGTAWAQPGQNGTAAALGLFAKVVSCYKKAVLMNVEGQAGRYQKQKRSLIWTRQFASLRGATSMRSGDPSAPLQGAGAAHHHSRACTSPHGCAFIGCPRGPHIGYIPSSTTLDLEKKYQLGIHKVVDPFLLHIPTSSRHACMSKTALYHHPKSL